MNSSNESHAISSGVPQSEWYWYPYIAMQSFFIKQKLAPILNHPLKDSENSTASMLDLGCGPGMCRPFFKSKDYWGVDLSSTAIAKASATLEGTFKVGSICSVAEVIPENKKFEIILFNSVLHHLNDTAVLEAFRAASIVASKGSRIYILELVRPSEIGIPRMMAYADLGRYARSIEQWEELVSKNFKIEQEKVYPLTFCSLEIWRMIFFQCFKQQT